MGTGILTPGQPRGATPSEFASGSIPNVVSFGFQGVEPPSQQYVQRDDVLIVTGNTSLAGGDVLTIIARLLLPVAQLPAQPSSQDNPATSLPVAVGPGTIQTITSTLALPSSGVTVSQKIPLAEGYLLALSVTSTAATAGQSFTTALLARASDGLAFPPAAQVLLADYPTAGQASAWPGVFVKQSAANAGATSSVHITSPGPGAEWSFTFGPAARTRLHAASFVMTSSASAATRMVRLLIKDSSGNILSLLAPNASFTGSQIANYTYGLGCVALHSTIVVGNTTDLMPLPVMDMLPNWTVGTLTNNLDAGDQWSGITLTLETWAQ